MSETTLYGEYANVRYYRLTQRGLEIGSRVFVRHLRGVFDKLLEVLEGYPLGLVRVIALSALDLRSGELGWIEVMVEGWDLSKALSHTISDIEFSLVDTVELREVYAGSKLVFGDLRLVFERLKRARAGMYKPRVYDVFVAKLLVRYNGEVRRMALELMEKLVELGLAGRIPLFDSKGKRYTDAYRAPPEVAYVLERYSSSFDMSHIRRHVLAAQLVMEALRKELTKSELLAALMGLGIPEEEVKSALEALYAKGVTSRYNEAGGPDSPPFIILDEERAKREAEAVVRLAGSLLLAP
ncbi:hypothetical protein [Pyrolobus fumarii]|nr:hypothetical protein [Pyrolobus fumarii]